eukprot:TRINITY_DN28426_c0_g1_i1.p1 TRINITY_DN28426_c0_g1~~TRINITY_DN28426_c0_g1_i1.p1  ORF type:complete len:845 (-),score=161.00 TRINITY_DN28426_c0_g1_i1:221-2689(-)
MANSTCPAKICDVGESGLYLPLFGDDEQRWPAGLRAVLYVVALFWVFMAVGLVCDIFMGAIETITSAKKRVYSKRLDTFVTVKVWNDTLANLTLMALGSSAPEILLSMIELLGNNMFAGDLGPGTIVGSAAFNLFVISAVCVSAIPGGEVRRIKMIQVFYITATFSVFSYVWMLIIVVGWTPDVITIEEGIITLLLFPLLLGLAYAADKGYFSKANAAEEDRVSLEAASEQEVAAMRMQILKAHGTGLNDEQIVDLIKQEFGKTEEPSRAARRMAATERMLGGRKKLTKMVPLVDETEDDKAETKKNKVLFRLEFEEISCLESCGTLELTVVREAEGDLPLGRGSVSYKTVEGTAKDNEDYIPVSGTLEFDAGEDRKTISVEIIDDDALEEDETFVVELSDPTAGDASVTACLGKHRATTVRIVDDDAIGELSFANSTEQLSEDTHGPKVHQVQVRRQGGSKGKISCKFRTEDGSATSTIDYEEVSGDLVFEDGQTDAHIEITIVPRARYSSSDLFRLYLEEVEGGATFSKLTDGGEECCICTILIQPDEKAKAGTDKLMKGLRVNWAKQSLAKDKWKQQFHDAVFLDPEGAEGSDLVMAYFFHLLSMPWKMLFACIPPTDYCGGWLCFYCSLVMIAIVTATISDLASLAGCVMNIPDAITAITFVALGTSLPDTFASKMAAEQDETADASIGNVTGSNSVNVFLGLGLPWSAGAIYWTAGGEVSASSDWMAKYAGEDVLNDYPKGGVFVVLSGSLGFSVGVFCASALICITLLLIRRNVKSIGGELGGPPGIMRATSAFFVFLWLLYVGLSIWDVMSKLKC